MPKRLSPTDYDKVTEHYSWLKAFLPQAFVACRDVTQTWRMNEDARRYVESEMGWFEEFERRVDEIAGQYGIHASSAASVELEEPSDVNDFLHYVNNWHQEAKDHCRAMANIANMTDVGTGVW